MNTNSNNSVETLSFFFYLGMPKTFKPNLQNKKKAQGCFSNPCWKKSFYLLFLKKESDILTTEMFIL